MKTPFLRTAYNYDTFAASNESGLACEEPTLAQQQFKAECDINNILKQFNVTGLLPQKAVSPRYGDFSGIMDYHSALNAVIDAEDEFMTLPADLRKRFDHDPAALVEFLADENNRDEAVKLGLVDPSPAAIAAEIPTPSEGGEATAQ